MLCNVKELSKSSFCFQVYNCQIQDKFWTSNIDYTDYQSFCNWQFTALEILKKKKNLNQWNVDIFLPH